MTVPSTCPGCGRPLASPDDCDTCEYFNLTAGRYHYCGQPGCHCRALAGTMRREVLARFAAEFTAAYGGRSYRDLVAERFEILYPRVVVTSRTVETTPDGTSVETVEWSE